MRVEDLMLEILGKGKGVRKMRRSLCLTFLGFGTVDEGLDE